jgi:hypothetical protein
VSIRIVKHESVEGFLSRAHPWLLELEAENNLILGIAGDLARSGKNDPATLLVTIESDGYVVGCAFRTPPYKLGLTRMPLKGIPPLVDVVAEAYDGLPGVLGPREEARYFSRIWCGPRALSFRPAMDQRIYKLDQLTEPNSWPDGVMRPALEVDKPVILDWLRRFFEETHMPVRNAQDVTDRLVPEGSMFLWDVGGTAVSMAGVTGRTPNGVRIGFVYTPVEERQNGYGTAITAALTRSVLDKGKKLCFLFTDASNPTSNSIYRALGYHPVADVVDYQFF